MITSLSILKLYMKAVFDSHLHFDRIIYWWLDSWDLNEDFVFLCNEGQPLALNFNADKVFHRDVATVV